MARAVMVDILEEFPSAGRDAAGLWKGSLCKCVGDAAWCARRWGVYERRGRLDMVVAVQAGVDFALASATRTRIED